MPHTFLLVSAAVLGALLPATIADCSRGTLQEAADNYISSQSTGQLHATFAESISYLENNKAVDIKKGVLSQGMKIDHNRTIIDSTNCATYTELIITNSKKPYVIGTQIHLNSTTSGPLKVALVDSIISSTGDWQFNATKSLNYVTEENWGPLTDSQQSTRAVIQAAADAYLDLWGNSKAPVPWGTPCERMEGSAYTGKIPSAASDSCNVGIPTGTTQPNTDRRYVVDETAGGASVLCTFGSMRKAPDSHEFRLVDGKLRYVHTMTVMTAVK